MVAFIDTDYFRAQPYGGKALDTAMPDEVLLEAITDASAYIEDYLDRRILEADYVERIPGNRRFTMILDNMPITALTGVGWVDSVGSPGTHDPAEFLVHAEAGIIEKINKLEWFRPDRVYIFEYTAGYAQVPGVIKRATALQTTQILRPAYGGPSDTAGEIVPFADELIVSLLERYRRKRLS